MRRDEESFPISPPMLYTDKDERRQTVGDIQGG